MSKQPSKQTNQSDGEADKPKPKGYEQLIARWTRILGISTIVLAVATGISAYFLFETDQSIKKQVEAAHTQLRAYVGVSQASSIKAFKESDQKIIAGMNIFVGWKNYGSTPAKNVVQWISAKWYGPGLEPDFDKPNDRIIEKSVATLGPGVEMGGGPVGVPIEGVQAALHHIGSVFVWGRAEYRDSFPDTPAHHYQFCFVAEYPTIDVVAFRVYRPECNHTD